MAFTIRKTKESEGKPAAYNEAAPNESISIFVTLPVFWNPQQLLDSKLHIHEKDAKSRTQRIANH
jgi:hypothetical protein